jgi:protein-S-isoprenylcysteine O-methyltransferase Ste14
MPADVPAPEHSEVIIFLPLIPLGGFVLGVVLEHVFPLASATSDGVRTGMRASGLPVFCLGAAGFDWMVVTMKRMRTPIHTSATPTALVETGPFRWTRNPMYLFGAVAYAGLALLLLEPWSLALLPLVMVVLHRGVVLREEAFLERRFGDSYRQYKASVRRWL